MRTIGKPTRAVSIILLLTFLHSVILPLSIFADEVPCGYDAANPTLESARNSFLGLNYECAEKELNDMLTSETLATEDKADVHILLAEVYYAKVRNDKDKRNKVMEQFVAAFDAYRQWKGEVNIKSPEFMVMMKEAQVMVDEKAITAEPEEAKKEVAEEKADETTTGMVEPIAVETEAADIGAATYESSNDESKPFYKKWWAMALGVGVVVGAVVLLGGGGDDGGTDVPLDTLPYFPPPPTESR